MLNKKQIVIGIIIIAILLGTVGVFWYMYQMRINENKSASEGQNADAEKGKKSTMITPTDFIEVDGIKVGMVLPEKWGHLVVPQLDERGLVLNVPKAMNQEQKYFSFRSHFTFDFGEKNTFTKMFAGYSYPVMYEYANTLPEITLLKVPDNFQDDALEEGPGENFTAWQKKAGINFLERVWQQQSVDVAAVEQACWGTPEYEKRNRDCFNKSIFWWAVNNGAVEDRIAVKYIESSDETLRGVGFFSVSAQDTPFGMDSYRVILFNPENKIAIQMVFPLQGEEFLSKEDQKKTLTDEERTARVDRGYDYIRDPKNYQSSELGQLMQDIQSIVGSLQIVSSDTVMTQVSQAVPAEVKILGTWVPVEKLAGGETLEDTFAIENGKNVYKTVINGKVYTGTWGMNEGTADILFWAQYGSDNSMGEPYTTSLAIDIDSKTGELIYYGEGADPDTMRWKKIK